MKHPRLLLFVLATVLLQATKCKIEPPKEECEPETTLTAPTQTGANTMSCLINGEVWVAQICPPNPNLGAEVHADWGLPDGGLTLSGVREFEYNTTRILSFNVDSIFGGGAYALSYAAYDDETSCIDYRVAHYYPGTGGTMTITKFDRTNYIIAGTFEAKLYSPDCLDTLYVTDGRFDVRE